MSKIIKRLLITMIVIISLLGYLFYRFFISMSSLPTGELIKEVKSPNGYYTVRAYVTNGGATVDYAVRGEVIFNKESRKAKNIYWNYHESKADIRWVDEEAVIINGRKLNVLRDVYDFRRSEGD